MRSNEVSEFWFWKSRGFGLRTTNLRWQIYMLLIYPKSKNDNLTDRETALLREFVKEL
jgi:hypothetical protein